MRKLLGFVVALLVLLGSGVWARAESDDAYVTLLYGDEFVLGVRVLGKSIRDTGTTKDMVILVTDGVSDYAQRLLKADGWILEHIKLLANPNHVRPKRFWGVYTKLKIFSLTKYRKVVYLDADTIVVKSIEDLFKCGRFCANLKHSERMNSGVMVVEPSETVFKDMMTKVNSLPSYTGGDQGFLNSYYADFASAHVFEPNISMQEINTKPEPELQRLSTLYNADVGLYMLANKWMVDEKELRVIHYTLGPLKPWDWWTAWLIKPVEVWQNIRERLEETLPGTGGGRNPHDLLVIKLLFILPFCMLFLCYYQSCLQINMDLFSVSCQSPLCGFVRHAYYKYKSGGGVPVYSSVGVASSSIASTSQQFPNGIHFKLPAYLGAFSVLICFISVAISLALAFVIIPQQVMPLSGLLLMYEWTFVTFFLIFGRYLHLVYLWGNANQVNYGNPDPSDDHGGKGHQRSASNCNYGTWFYWMGMAFLALTAPLLPTLLGITALFARLGLMVAGGLVLASYMTYASEHLAIRAFVEGLKAHDLPRTRKICLLC